MFGLSARDRERLDHIEDRVEKMHVLLERLDVNLTIRDPGNAHSADAYDGLRKAVAANSSHRRHMNVHLAELRDRIAAGSSIDDVASILEEWIGQAGLVRLDSADRSDFFDVVAGEGDSLRVLRPAWIDGLNNSVVRRGQVERVPVPVASPPDATDTGPGIDLNERAESESNPTPADKNPDANDSPGALSRQASEVAHSVATAGEQETKAEPGSGDPEATARINS
jgi:hypothetical protein